jgi:hypothetical protein
MPSSVNRLIGRVAQSAAFYRLVPPGSARIFGGLRYHYTHQNWSIVNQFARADLRRTTEYFSSGILAARAGFYAAEDDLSETIIERLIDRFPAEPQPYEIRANVNRFRGRHSDAWADAERARLLIPSSRKAVERVIRYSYLANPPEVADQIALEELRRYPRSTRLYWAVARSCRDTEQFQRILQVWRDLNEAESITLLVHPLATAAAAAEEIECASELYRMAIQMAAKVGVPDRQERQSDFIETSDALAGIHDVMSTAGVPYFFAAGTAFALVRRGGQVGQDGRVDVGVFDSDWNRSKLEQIFSTDSRFALDAQHPNEPKIALVHRSGVEVNVFRFYLDDGRLWHDSIFGRSWNTPFKIEMHRIGSHLFPLPSEATTYLRENYGDDWKMADRPSLALNEPNLDVSLPEYERLYSLRRSFEQVRTGDLSAAARELVDAEEGELASVLEVGRG